MAAIGPPAGPRRHPDERHAPGAGGRRADAHSSRSGPAAWDQAWDITLRTLAYTNHTLLPEALERWPVELFEVLIPRHLEIVYEINRRFLDDVRRLYPGDEARVQRMSLIEEGPVRKVRMAHLAVVGSHSTNGVAAIHSDLLRTRVLRDFANVPGRFNNKTNGVTPRRWLQQANPFLSGLITRRSAMTGSPTSGNCASSCRWPTTRGFREQFRDAKRAAKVAFANWLKADSGQIVDPDSIFDSQIKRIHEYKRQLLNVLHIIILYNRLRHDPESGDDAAHVLLRREGGAGLPSGQADHQTDQQRRRHDQRRPVVRGRLKVLFLPEYNVSMAERLIPGKRCLRADLHRRLRGERHRQHEIHDERRADHRHPRRGDDRNGRRKPARRTSFYFGLTAQQVADSAAGTIRTGITRTNRRRARRWT
jgi:starch phosphorylase